MQPLAREMSTAAPSWSLPPRCCCRGLRGNFRISLSRVCVRFSGLLFFNGRAHEKWKSDVRCHRTLPRVTRAIECMQIFESITSLEFGPLGLVKGARLFFYFRVALGLMTNILSERAKECVISLTAILERE
jgi:hypothetical protein